MNKFFNVLGYILIGVLGYILIGIILLPLALVALYLSLGGGVFILLYIKNRMKYGKMNNPASKPYKNLSAVLIILLSLFIYMQFGIAPLTVVGYFKIQLIVFIGLIPMCIYFLKNLKNQIS